MNKFRQMDVLPFLRGPSSYLGSEINAYRKSGSQVRLRIALVFPDLYEVGVSNVGLQVLYHILNEQPGIAAERVFAPRPDLEHQLRSRNIALTSLETKTPLSKFDIVGFSLPYELTYTNILNILDLGGIPLFAKDRSGAHPLIIAGGPCAFNPEPVAEFFDAIVIGDGEQAVVDLAHAWLKRADNATNDHDRTGLLDELSKIRGVYVPSLMPASTASTELEQGSSERNLIKIVKKAVVTDLNLVSYPTKPVVPFGSPVHDRVSLEIARGCTRGCRFCQAGMIYRPVRERSVENLFALAVEALRNTGYEEISMLSLSSGDYGAIEQLVSLLMNECEAHKTAVSLPSLRVGTLTDSLMAQIKRVRKTGFTIAPEAASARLRLVINKDISEEALAQTVVAASALGWSLIKLYFMVGLPTETGSDVEEIVAMVKRLQRLGSRGRRMEFNVGVSTFVPKSHTPFQWSRQISLKESTDKITMLRHGLTGKKGGARVKWQQPSMSMVEGLLARGDRSLSRLIVKAYELGCRLDAWSDHFNYDLWQKAADACGLNLETYVTRAFDPAKSLPWDHIDSGVSKDFLHSELQRSLDGQLTQDCRFGNCHGCGVCDFETIRPVTFTPMDTPVEAPGVAEPCRDVIQIEPYKKVWVTYSRLGPAKYFGHLELVRVFLRALRRAGIALRYTEGFHPAPKVSFHQALAVGLESAEEAFCIETPRSCDITQLAQKLNSQLPEGLTVIDCSIAAPKIRETMSYEVTLTDGAFSSANLEKFEQSHEYPVTRKGHNKETVVVDLKKIVKHLSLDSAQSAKIVLSPQSGQNVRVPEIFASIFDLSEELIALANVLKRPQV